MKRNIFTLITTFIFLLQFSFAHAAKPTKIMILWASIGRGHYAAMKSIEDEIKRMNPGAEIVEYDVREKMNPVRNAIGKLQYEYSTKFNPQGYDTWWKSYITEGEKIASLGDMYLVPENKPLKILEAIKTEQPQVVISTFMHATEALIHLRDQGELMNVDIGQVMTDFVNRYYFQRLGERVEMSFVPHETIRQTWIGRGFDPSRVTTIGMPVKAAALTPITDSEKLEFLRSKRLDPSIPTVVLVSGSAGVGNFEKAVKSIADQFGSKRVQVIAVCGESLMNHDRLAFALPKLPKTLDLRVYQSVENAELLKFMKASTVVVTKSGGGSISEVAALGKPMVLMDINGGQEFYNSEFFPAEKMALSVKSESDVGSAVKTIVENPSMQQEMLAAQAKYREMLKPKAAAEWTLKASKARLDRSFGNRGVLAYNDHDAGDIRWDLIERENQGIGMIYYMIDGRKIGPTAIAALWAKAKQGVPAVLVMDGWAPSKWLEGNLDPAMLAAAMADGVEIYIYNPVNRDSWKTWFSLTTYKRTHDKIGFYKGLRVMNLSDRNMQNANFGLQKWGQPYRSIEFAVQGPIFDSGWEYFEQVRRSPRAKPLDVSQITPEQVTVGRAKLQKYLDVMLNAVKTGKHVRQDWIAQMQPIGEISFFHDSVAYKGKVTGTEQNVIEIIDSAQKELILVSPYIVLTPKVEAAVLRAVRDRHVKLTIYTAAAHATDVRDSVIAFEAQIEKLKALGVVVYQHQGPKLMHAKAALADGTHLAVMTHNIDAISEYINLESGLDIMTTDDIKNEAIIAKFKEFVAQVQSESKLFEKPTDIPWTAKAKTCAQLFISQIWPSVPQAWK